MMRKILAIAFLLSFPIGFIAVSVYKSYPCPFETRLMGQSIKFPTDIGTFSKDHPTLPVWHGAAGKSIYRDSSQQNRYVEWLFRPTLAQNGDNRPLYGVNLYLPGHHENLGLVKTSLEKQFAIQFSLLGPLHSNPIYTASLSDCTRLFIQEYGHYEGGPAQGVRITISNHLSDEEAEYFAKSGRDYEPEVD